MSPLHYRFEQTLAWHCAPSLAGIKAADLLTWTVEGREGADLLSHYAGMLSSRGVRLYVLGSRRGRTLLLIFRAPAIRPLAGPAPGAGDAGQGGLSGEPGDRGHAGPPPPTLTGRGVPPRDRSVPGLSPGRCGGLSPGTVAATASCAAPGRYMTTWRRPPALCRLPPLPGRADRAGGPGHPPCQRVPRRVLTLSFAVTAQWALTNTM